MLRRCFIVTFGCGRADLFWWGFYCDIGVWLNEHICRFNVAFECGCAGVFGRCVIVTLCGGFLVWCGLLYFGWVQVHYDMLAWLCVCGFFVVF